MMTARKLIPLAAAAALTAGACAARADARDDLYAAFCAPPPEIKVGCYYYWVNERVDEAGVRKDLEWMKTNGITRAFLATDIRNRTRVENPWDGQTFGDCTFQSEKWWRCLRTALKTAGELTAKLNTAADPTRAQLADTLTGLNNLASQLSALMERLEDNPDQLLRGNRAPAVK